MKRIDCNALSSADVKRARQELVSYKADVQLKFNQLMQALADKGVELARDNLKAYAMPYSTGELYDSIQGVFDAETGRGAIFTDCNHAAYVEFGTGVRGAQSPHPDAGAQGYAYDVNDHGESGWWYYKDGFWWTAGMPSRPFMWPVKEQLEQVLDDLAKQVFAGSGS